MNATTASLRIDTSPGGLPVRKATPNAGSIGGYSVVCRSWAHAVAVLREDPAVRVIVFEDTWDLVDLGREMIDRLGLRSKVRVVHAAAMGLWTPPGARRPAA